MTKEEAFKKMNYDVQQEWIIISIALSLSFWVIVGVVFWFLFDWNELFLFIVGLVGVVFSVKELYGKITIENMVVPAGSKGLVFYEGELIAGDNTLENINIPIVTAIDIPVLGKQVKFDVEVVNMRPQSKSVEIEDITTYSDGIRIEVILELYYQIFDIVSYTQNKRSNEGSTGETTGDSSSENKMTVVLKLSVKDVADSFTYQQIDDSEKCSKNESPYKELSFGEAIFKAVTHKHGLTCTDCGDGSVDVVEWGIKIIKVLPQKTLAINPEVLKAREGKIIMLGEREGQEAQITTVAKVASILRSGKFIKDGKVVDLYEGGVKNPYAKMPDKDIHAAIERMLKIRGSVKEVIFTSSGGGGGTSSATEALIASMIANQK